MHKAVVIVNRSEMSHNRGEIFYAVRGIDDRTGCLVPILNHGAMPFIWGFRVLDHAMQVADAWNDFEGEACPVMLCARFSDIERGSDCSENERFQAQRRIDRMYGQ